MVTSGAWNAVAMATRAVFTPAAAAAAARGAGPGHRHRDGPGGPGLPAPGQPGGTGPTGTGTGTTGTGITGTGPGTAWENRACRAQDSRVCRHWDWDSPGEPGLPGPGWSGGTGPAGTSTGTGTAWGYRAYWDNQDWDNRDWNNRDSLGQPVLQAPGQGQPEQPGTAWENRACGHWEQDSPE